MLAISNSASRAIEMPEICLSIRPVGHDRTGTISGAEEEVFDWHDLIYVLDFFHGSGISEVCFSGETPQLHPDLHTILLYAQHRQFPICICTTGFSMPWMKEIEERSPLPRDVRIVCRMPAFPPVLCQKAATDFLRRHGSMITLKLLVLSERFDPRPFIETIREYGLRRELVLSLVPCSDSQHGTGLRPEQYGSVRKQFIESLETFTDAGIFPVWDRGLPLCAFGNSDLGRSCRAGTNHNWAAALDFVVYPDLTVSPVSVPRRRSRLDMLELNTIADIPRRLVQQASGYLFKKCEECPSRARNQCGENIYLNWTADRSDGGPA
jgi:hypothetical protein